MNNMIRMNSIIY